MNNKLVIDYKEITSLVSKIARELALGNWKPDYIVGLTRGGLVPAVMLSHYLDIPMFTLNVSLRDGDGRESNLWMAEDALGPQTKDRFINDANDIGSILEAASSLLEEGATYKNILIVDDINDQGSTINWIMDDWKSSCLPGDPSWDEVWNNNVRFAVLVDNLSSKCNVSMDYAGMEINKAENDVWVDFPWEDWWTK